MSGYLPFSMNIRCVLFLLIFLFPILSKGIGIVDSTRNNRLPLVLGLGAAAYSGAMVGLSQAWYKDQRAGSFHFFDDFPQWKQMDKFGHMYSAYQVSFAAHGVYRWAGLDDKKAAIWGAATSGIMMLPVEILDGFSEDFGFSWSDVGFNTLGAGIFLSQQLAWNEMRIIPKFSFMRTQYASLRPGTLGSGWSEEWLKDYNGQTYWFSFNPYLLTKGNTFFPKWLAFSVGYSASDMLYGRDAENLAAGYDPYRRYFLSLDVDFKAFKGKSTFVNTLLDALNLIKVPAPALEWNRKSGLKAHGVYF